MTRAPRAPVTGPASASPAAVGETHAAVIFFVFDPHLEVIVKLPILVGIDRSEATEAALEWAATAAARRGVALRLLHAFPWPLLGVPIDPRSTGAWADAERLVEESERHAARIAPGIDVTGELADDGPSAALLTRAGDAALIVVGNRGRGGFTGLIIGSTALQVAGHSPAPVVVVGGRPAAAGDIVVGVGTEPADGQLAAGFEEAALHGARLKVIHSFLTTESGMAADRTRSDEEDRLAAQLAPWRTAHPDIPVAVEVVEARARHVLIEASESARLLVLGTREHPGFTTSGLGSVTHAVVHNARCPVLITRATG